MQAQLAMTVYLYFSCLLSDGQYLGEWFGTISFTQDEGHTLPKNISGSGREYYSYRMPLTWHMSSLGLHSIG